MSIENDTFFIYVIVFLLNTREKMISQMRANYCWSSQAFQVPELCHPINKCNFWSIASFSHVSFHPEIPEISAVFLSSLNSGSFRQISKEYHQVALCWAMQHLSIGSEKWSWNYLELTFTNSFLHIDVWFWFGYHCQVSKKVSVFLKLQ